MTTIKRVALAGASGNLGPAILEALLAAGFQVTVLTREGSKSQFPSSPSLKVSSVDYESLDSLVDALKGHDALVSTLASLAINTQIRLIDAAAAAGVYRIIPSEFGSETTKSPTRDLPVFGFKVQVQKYLEKKAAETPITYTLILNSAFLDWGLMVGFVVNAKERKAELYDGGNRPFSATRLSTVGQGVVGVLKNLKATENRAVRIQDAVVTQNQLVGYAEKLSGDKFQTTVLDTAKLEQDGYAELKKEEPNMMLAMYNFIKRAIWADGYGGQFTEVDNELLGIKGMKESEIEELVGRYL